MTSQPFRRLLDSELDTYTRDALRSAARDRGSEQALGRILAAVAPPVGAPVPGPSAPPALAAQSTLKWAVLKGVTAGVFVGAGAISLAAGVGWNSPPKPSVASRVMTASPGHGRATMSPPASGASPRSPDRRELPSNVAPREASAPESLSLETGAESAAVPPHPARAVPRVSGLPAAATRSEPAVIATRDAATIGSSGVASRASELSREVALLDEARRLLALGNAVAALETLDRREREISVRALEPEALVVRVDALVASNQPGRATQLLKAALAKNPNRPGAERLRRMLEKIP